jgi:hypothetical protein
VTDIRRVPKKFKRRDWKFRSTLGVAESDWVLMLRLERFHDWLSEMSSDPRLDPGTLATVQTELRQLYREAAELCGFGYLYDPAEEQRRPAARSKSGEHRAKVA